MFSILIISSNWAWLVGLCTIPFPNAMHSLCGLSLHRLPESLFGVQMTLTSSHALQNQVSWTLVNSSPWIFDNCWDRTLFYCEGREGGVGVAIFCSRCRFVFELEGFGDVLFLCLPFLSYWRGTRYLATSDRSFMCRCWWFARGLADFFGGLALLYVLTAVALLDSSRHIQRIPKLGIGFYSLQLMAFFKWRVARWLRALVLPSSSFCVFFFFFRNLLGGSTLTRMSSICVDLLTFVATTSLVSFMFSGHSLLPALIRSLQLGFGPVSVG